MKLVKEMSMSMSMNLNRANRQVKQDEIQRIRMKSNDK